MYLNWRNNLLPFLALPIIVLAVLPLLWVGFHVFAPDINIWQHLWQTRFPDYVINSLGLAFFTAVATLLIGTFLAWFLALFRFPGSRFLEWAVILPLALPAYVAAYVYTGFFDYSGQVQEIIRETMGFKSKRDYWFPEIRSLEGAAIMLSLTLYPYVYMLGRAAFAEQAGSLMEAARSLGHGPISAFFKTALPLARPSLAAGLALVLMETLNDFGTVQFFAVDTFTTGIYRTWLGLGEKAAAIQLGAILLLLALLALWLEKHSRGQAKFYRHGHRLQHQKEISGAKGWLLSLLCFLPLFFGFVLPAFLLGEGAIKSGARIWNFFDFAFNSLLVSGLAALFAVVTAIVLAYAQRKNPRIKSGVRLATLGYAAPGAVVAVGILAAANWGNEHWGLNIILTGSIGGLVFAYWVRFLAVAFDGVDASLSRITPSLEGAARTLGANNWEVLQKLHLPLMRPSILSVMLLVFVDSLKELPATLMIRPFNFDTLAVKAFELANDERLSEAAIPALFIVVVGLLPLIFLVKASQKRI